MPKVEEKNQNIENMDSDGKTESQYEKKGKNKETKKQRNKESKEDGKKQKRNKN